MKIVLRYKEKNSHRDDGYDGTEWGVREIENVNTAALKELMKQGKLSIL